MLPELKLLHAVLLELLLHAVLLELPLHALRLEVMIVVTVIE